MRHPVPTLLLAALLAAASWRAAAVVVDGLHEARVPVADQGAEARTRAFRDALAEVLVRVTGDRLAASAPDLAPLMRNPQRLLDRYAYAEEVLVDAVPGAPVSLMLEARFDPGAVERALREAGRPIWGRERPAILVWTAVDDGATRRFVGEDGGEAADAVRATARARGLAVRFPALDAGDREALTFADLWGGFEDRALAAVAPYGADLAVVGGVTRAGTQWQGRWLVLGKDGSVTRRQSQGASLALAVGAVLDALADDVAAEHAVHVDPALVQELELTIDGVTDVAAYARTLRHLEGLSLVRSVQVARVAATVLTLRVVHAGTSRNLEQAIALGGVLVAAPGAAGALRYTYLP